MTGLVKLVWMKGKIVIFQAKTLEKDGGATGAPLIELLACFYFICLSVYHLSISIYSFLRQIFTM